MENRKDIYNLWIQYTTKVITQFSLFCFVFSVFFFFYCDKFQIVKKMVLFVVFILLFFCYSYIHYVCLSESHLFSVICFTSLPMTKPLGDYLTRCMHFVFDSSFLHTRTTNVHVMFDNFWLYVINLWYFYRFLPFSWFSSICSLAHSFSFLRFWV